MTKMLAAQFLLLETAHESLLERIRLCRQAQQSINLQYYLWRDDLSGLTLLNELVKASRRGVQVSLLLDDFHSSAVERLLRDLQRLPNFAVKLFNPLRHRRLRWLNYFLDFKRVNRRMHNKAMVIDNSMAIVGGRNVGDEYFGVHAGELFSDLDVLVQGDVVRQIQQDWASYWGCDLAVDIANIPGRSQTEAFLQRWQRHQQQIQVQQLRDYVLNEPLSTNLTQRQWIEAQANWVSDDPLKASIDRKPLRLVTQQMTRVLGQAKQQLRMVSPYFVPTSNGVRELEQLSEQGVDIQVLTNSLAATDVPAVHAGYQRSRRRLLMAGIKLYELRRLEDTQEQKKVLPYFRRSATSLHAKTITVDERQVFVGSFNFDPRSAQINTEAGLVIASATIAKQINAMFANELPFKTFQPRLNRFYKLYWLDKSCVPARRYYREPKAGVARRLMVWLTARLPVEHLL
jgi:putative cardiolipin synthase